MRRLNWGLAFALAAMSWSTTPARAQATWHVDEDNCPGPGTGSMPDSFCLLQDALSAAGAGDENREVRGTYRPAAPGGAANGDFSVGRRRQRPRRLPARRRRRDGRFARSRRIRDHAHDGLRLGAGD